MPVITRSYLWLALYSLLAIFGGACGAYLNDRGLMALGTLAPCLGIAAIYAWLRHVESTQGARALHRP